MLAASTSALLQTLTLGVVLRQPCIPFEDDRHGRDRVLAQPARAEGRLHILAQSDRRSRSEAVATIIHVAEVSMIGRVVHQDTSQYSVQVFK